MSIGWIFFCLVCVAFLRMFGPWACEQRARQKKDYYQKRSS
jgi:hypothetical protein